MSRLAVLFYGVLVYLLFLGTFLYAIGFLANSGVTRSVDRGGPDSTFGTALVVNVALLLLFGLQHTVMARPAFKAWWTRIIPEPVERSTYVLLSSILLILLFWQWRPLTDPVWTITSSAGAGVMWGLYALGWIVLLIATFIIDHFDLFGLRQVWLYYKGRPFEPPQFKTVLFYKLVRHPIMLGWLIIFWSTPQMTVGHLTFAIVTTVYILVAIQIEERDLKKLHGEDYSAYQRSVFMLLPIPKGRK